MKAVNCASPGRPKGARLAEREEAAVVVEAVPARVGGVGIVDGGVALAQRHAREQGDRAVLAPEVAPADVEEAARRHVELLRRGGAVGALPQPPPHFQTAAIRHRGGIGLLDFDEHVVGGVPGARQLADADTAEQPERGQAPLALDHRVVAHRAAGPQREFPPDHVGAGPHVAGNQDLVHLDLRTLVDGPRDRHLAVVAGERELRRDRRALEPAVAVHALDGVAIDGQLRAIERLAGTEHQQRAQLGLRDGRRAAHVDGADEGPGAFLDLKADVDGPERHAGLRVRR